MRSRCEVGLKRFGKYFKKKKKKKNLACHQLVTKVYSFMSQK